MATPTQFVTTNIEGVDVTQWFNVSASLTPETPAPPFAPGNVAMGQNGAEYVFVQASTTINLGAVLQISQTNTANGLISTNIASSLGCRIGTTGAVTSIGASLTYIPAGAYFWAQVRGGPVALTQSSTLTSQLGATGAPQLYTTATAGVISSATVTLPAIAGIECVSSTTPLVILTWPRGVAVVANQSLAALPNVGSNV